MGCCSSCCRCCCSCWCGCCYDFSESGSEMRKGNNFMKRSQYEEAIICFKKAKKKADYESLFCNWRKYCECNLGFHPRNRKIGTAWHQIAVAENELGNYYNALESSNKAISNAGPKGSSYIQCGKAHFGLKEYSKAISCFDKAITIRESPEAYLKKGDALQKLNKYREAIFCYDNCLKMQKSNKLAINNKKSALEMIEKVENNDESKKLLVTKAVNKGEKIDKISLEFEKLMDGNPKLRSLVDESMNKQKDPPPPLAFPHNPLKCETALALKKKIASNEIIDISGLLLLQKTDFQDDSYIRETYNQNDIRIIGSGAFGKVIMGEKMQGKEKIKLAVKVIETNDLNVLIESTKELQNLSKVMGHPNIMNYLTWHINQVQSKNLSQLLIEMPLADCSLEKILKKRVCLEEDEIFAILKDLITGLSFAHEQNMSHLDLKPDNILVKDGIFMIADWGGSLSQKSAESTIVKSSLSTTPGYEAPEIDGENYGSKLKYNYHICDVYSLGLIILRMCGIEYKKIKSIPKDPEMIKLHDDALKIIFESINEKYSKNLLDIVKRMTEYNVDNRISISEIQKLSK